MEPLDALNRIAFLLERSGADTYKVRAFRTRRAPSPTSTPTRSARWPEAGRLQSIDGVGKSTAQVIAEALDGKVPDRLTQLEDRRPTTWSSTRRRRSSSARCAGTATPTPTGPTAGAPSARWPRRPASWATSTWCSPTTAPASRWRTGSTPSGCAPSSTWWPSSTRSWRPFRILTGIEVDILEDGALDQELDLLAELDVVVASVHSKLRMEAPAMTERMLAAIESPHTDILGHCTGRLITGRGRAQSTFDADAVFGACARTGTAVEINSRPERQDPPQDLLRQAVSLGCSFAVDTDAHAPGQLGWLGRGCAKAVDADVPPERIVNRGSVDELLAWAGAHEG